VQYEAQASVLLSAPGGPAVVEPLLPSAREVATSAVLAGDVQSTLRLPGSPERLRKHIRATTPHNTQLIAISFTDRSRTRARQIAQEIAVLLTRLVPARFRTATPSLKITIFDQSHIVSRSGPDYLGDSLIGAAIGLVVGLVAVALTKWRFAVTAPAGADGALGERERRLEERIKAVSKRETALARHAGELAERERALAATPATHEPVPPRSEPAPAPASPPILEPQPKPAPVVVAETAERTLAELERLVRVNAERFPDSVDEWNAYLFYLRDYADATGRLPASFDGLINDVFGGLEEA
jgi:hypothetical protein